MDVAHVGLVHRDPCECKVKGFRVVSSIERNVPKRRHLQGVRQHLCCCNSLLVYYCISNLHRMPRQLPVELRQNVISMLERGCGLREIFIALHVSLGSVHNIQHAHVSSAMLRHRGRPHVMTKAMERSCVLEVTRARLSTTVDATRQLKKDFGIQVSTNTVRRALHRHGLNAQVKEKKPQTF